MSDNLLKRKSFIFMMIIAFVMFFLLIISCDSENKQKNLKHNDENNRTQYNDYEDNNNLSSTPSLCDLEPIGFELEKNDDDDDNTLTIGDVYSFKVTIQKSSSVDVTKPFFITLYYSEDDVIDPNEDMPLPEVNPLIPVPDTDKFNAENLLRFSVPIIITDVRTANNDNGFIGYAVDSRLNKETFGDIQETNEENNILKSSLTIPVTIKE